MLRICVTVALLIGCSTPEPVSDEVDNVPPDDAADRYCVGMSPTIYPTSYAWCRQSFGPTRAVPFVCSYVPPSDACESMGIGDPQYAERFCCCDPSLDAACDFYR